MQLRCTGRLYVAKPAKDISVGAILRALEGDLNPVDCSEINNNEGNCDNSDSCNKICLEAY